MGNDTLILLRHREEYKPDVLRLTHSSDRFTVYSPSNTSEVQRAVARSLRETLKNGILSFTYDYPALDVSTFLHWFFHNHPEFFWISNHYTIGGGTRSYTITFTNCYSPQETETLRRSICDAVDTVCHCASSGVTATEKLCLIYESFCTTIRYSKRNRPENYTIVGALRDHEAVCLGISKAFMLVCQRLHIPCGIVTGALSGSVERHAWNIVELSGYRYHIDVTSGINFFAETQKVGYPIFMVLESELAETRTIDYLSRAVERPEGTYGASVGTRFSDVYALRHWLAATRFRANDVYTLFGTRPSWNSKEDFLQSVLDELSVSALLLHSFHCYAFEPLSVVLTVE